MRVAIIRMSLANIAQQLTIYGGFFLLIGGVIGNGFNIFIFLVEKNYRQTPSIFFFLIGSIVSTMHLVCNLTVRILSVGYGIDLTIKYIFVCRIRNGLLAFFGLIVFTCSCLTSIDQYVTTSRQQSIRKYSDIKLAHRIMLIMIPFWFAYCSPNWMFYDIVNGFCINTSPTLIAYNIYGYFIFLFGLPILLLTIFGYLAYRNTHQIQVLVNQQADRQITRITLMQTIIVCLSIFPYGILNIYGLSATGISKNLDQQMAEYLFASVASLVSYAPFSVSFSLSNHLKTEINWAFSFVLE